MSFKKTDESTVIGRQIARRITRDGLASNPEIYAVLYAHYSGRHADISYAITTWDREGSKLTTRMCENLYETYLARRRSPMPKTAYIPVSESALVTVS